MGDVARLEAVVARIEAALDTLERDGGAALARIERALGAGALESLSAAASAASAAAGGGMAAAAAPPPARHLAPVDDTALGDEIETAVAAHERELASTVISFGEKHAPARLSANASTSGEVEEQTDVLIAFDELSRGKLSEYFECSVALGPPVSEQTELVRKAFVAQRRLIKIAPHTREPGPKILKQLLEAIEESIKAVKAFATTHMDDDHMLHLLGVAEGVVALAWVSTGLQWRSDLKQTPVEWIEQFIASTEREYIEGIYEEKRGQEKHIKWAKAFIDSLKELLEYVKKWHPTNLAWGNKMRSMTFWSNALAQTAPGDSTADQYEFSTKLGIPISKHAEA